MKKLKVTFGEIFWGGFEQEPFEGMGFKLLATKFITSWIARTAEMAPKVRVCNTWDINLVLRYWLNMKVVAATIRTTDLWINNGRALYQWSIWTFWYVDIK